MSYTANVIVRTQENMNFRTVLFTGGYMQRRRMRTPMMKMRLSVMVLPRSKHALGD